MKSELTILTVWYEETNQDRIECFEENKRSLIEYNPGIEIITIMNPFEDPKEAWLNTDLAIFLWYKENRYKIKSERFLLLEWDCWCNINLKEYYRRVWDLDVVAPTVLYPERDNWHWFQKLDKMPVHARLYATGIIPFCGILVSEKAMNKICEEIIKSDYHDLISELRFPTIATMLSFDPVPNPVCSRTITWKSLIPFEQNYKGLHHPRKTMVSAKVLDDIEHLLNLDENKIPMIIHQSWNDTTLPNPLTKIRETWKKFQPNWEYVLWTDDMNRELIKRFFPHFLLQFDSYDNRTQRENVAKYFVLHKIGGIFIDLDFECLENIEPLLTAADCVFGLEPAEHCEQLGRKKIISNAFMACKPQNTFLKVVCDSLPYYVWKDDAGIKNISSSTGSFALTEIYDNYEMKSEIKILPSHTIYPLTAKEAQMLNTEDQSDFLLEKIENAYALNYFLRHWH